MRCYKRSHQFYCGIDLHARSMYLCILDHDGREVFDRNLAASPTSFLRAVSKFREDLVVAAECMFSWYWLADLCLEEDIHFVLGHALYMKAIHGGKAKNDRIDAGKIAHLLRGGNLPMAYVYPRGMRETRDLLRRRSHLVQLRGKLIAHIQNTNSQYNLPPFGKKLIYARNRAELDIVERFADEQVRKSIEVNLAIIDPLEEQIAKLDWYLEKHAKTEDGNNYLRLQSIPGVGKILALCILYEIHNIRRFDNVGQFLSYARLIRPLHETGGKIVGSGQKKIGNAHLRWALGEAVCLLLRECDKAKRWMQRREKKYGKPKAMGILAAKLARTIYAMLLREEVFDIERFLAS